MPAAHAQPPAGHSRPQDTTATQQWGRSAEDSSSQPNNRGQPAQAPVPRASESQPLPTMGLPPATSNIDNAWLETCATLSRVRAAGGQNVAIGSRLPNFRKPVYQELPSISAYNAGRENTGILNRGNPATQPIPNPSQQPEDFGDFNFNNPSSITGQNSLNAGLGLGVGQGAQGGNNTTLGMSTYSAAGPLLGSTAPVGHLMSAPPQSNSLYSANYDISNPAPAPSAPASMNDTQATRGGYNPTFNPSPFTEHIQFPKGIPVHSQKEEAPPIPVPPVSTDPLFDIEGMVNLMSQGMGAPFAPMGAGQFGGPPAASVPPSHPRPSLSKEHSAGAPIQPQTAAQPPPAVPTPTPAPAAQSFGLSSGGGRAYPSPHQTRPGRPHSPALRSGSPGRIQAAQPAATNPTAPSTPSRSAQTPPTHASFGPPHDASRENSIGQLNRSQNSSSAPHPKGHPQGHPPGGPLPPHHTTTHTFQNKEYHHQRRGSGGQPSAQPQAAGGVSPMKPPGASLGPQPEAHTTGLRSASNPSQGSRRHSNGSIPPTSQQHPHLQRAAPPNASLRPPPSSSRGMPQPGHQPQHGYPSPAPTPSGQQAPPAQSAPSMQPRSSSPAPLAPPNDGRRLSGNRKARAPSGGPGAPRQPPPQQQPPQGPGTQAVVPPVAPPSAPSATPPPQSGGLFNRRPSTGSTGKPARLLGSWLKKRPSDPSPASPPPSSGRGVTPPPPRSSLGGRIADNSAA